MVYQWKLPGLFPVDAQIAGAELERISAARGLSPEAVVEENTPEDAPLHSCFEWDDKRAAGLYRVSQAGEIIRAVVIVKEPEDGGAQATVRAFVNVTPKHYEPLNAVMQEPDKREALLQTAFREFTAFRLKYQTLQELAPLFATFDQVKENADV